MRILIVDDNSDIRQYLKEILTSEGFVTDTAGDGESGSYMARVNTYDAIILDNILPKKNGKEVIKDIRQNKICTPILMLSVEDELDTKVSLIDMGADDYLSKPFSAKELLARIRALIRRPQNITPSILKAGDLSLDTLNQKASRGGKEIYLTRKEFALIEYLMRNKGNVISRGVLMEHAWQDGADPFSNAIETHIRNLRKKIEFHHRGKLIHTVPGRGYKIDTQTKIFN